MDGWHGTGSFLTQPLLSLCITHKPDRAREQESEQDEPRERESECETVMDTCRTLNKRTVKSLIV